MGDDGPCQVFLLQGRGPCGRVTHLCGPAVHRVGTVVSVCLSQCLPGLSVQNNIGLVLHGVMEYDLSLRFLENALAISSKYHGSKSLKVALR